MMVVAQNARELWGSACLAVLVEERGRRCAGAGFVRCEFAVGTGRVAAADLQLAEARLHVGAGGFEGGGEVIAGLLNGRRRVQAVVYAGIADEWFAGAGHDC